MSEVSEVLDTVSDCTDDELREDLYAIEEIETFFDNGNRGLPDALVILMSHKNAEYVDLWKPIVLAEMKRRGIE